MLGGGEARRDASWRPGPFLEMLCGVGEKPRPQNHNTEEDNPPCCFPSRDLAAKTLDNAKATRHNGVEGSSRNEQQGRPRCSARQEASQETSHMQASNLMPAHFVLA